jgi:hypothetical protein
LRALCACLASSAIDSIGASGSLVSLVTDWTLVTEAAWSACISGSALRARHAVAAVVAGRAGHAHQSL